MKPFLKWAGGKSQLLPYIAEYYPFENYKFKKYAEPFIGGGAVLFDILGKYNDLDAVYISDINPNLINTYQSIKKYVDDVIYQLLKYQEKFWILEQEERKELFYRNRDRFNELTEINFINHINVKKLTKQNIELAALFIFLNRTCFNGLYRVNKKGLFNVPIGSYKKPLICDSANLQSVSRGLQKVTIVNDTYKAVESFVDDKTFVYIDPPYRPLSDTANFTSYTQHEFDDCAQIELGLFAESLSKKGARILLSNSDPKNTNPDDDFFDLLYKNFKIERIEATRAINSVSSKRGKVSELLISSR